MLTPILCQVKNLNRCYRTAYSFGCREIIANDCGDLCGNLYRAKDQVDLIRNGPVPRSAVVAEIDGDCSASELDWSGATHIVLGGESYTVPVMDCYARVSLCAEPTLCLTVEAALAICLYACQQPPPRIRCVGYGLWAAAMPLRREVLSMKGRVNNWYDLTQRPRPTLERACIDVGINYHKRATAYDSSPGIDFIEPPAVVSCFHGRDRTGRVVQEWRAAHC